MDARLRQCSSDNIFAKMKLLLVFALVVTQIFGSISALSIDQTTHLNDSGVAVKRDKRATGPTCIQPPITPDKSYTVKYTNKEGVFDAKPGEAVPKHTIIEFKCNEGYAADYQTDAVPNELLSVCSSNSWQPPIPKCKRICKNFAQFSNFNLTCHKYFDGPEISCTGLLLERAFVTLKCKNKFHPDRKVTHDNATCREDGHWDNTFFECKPDCGQVSSRSVTLIRNGSPEKRGGAPWNVAIYSSDRSPEKPQFICGGTLITAELVVSAAHCFYDEIFHQSQDKELFHVVVGKATQDYVKEDYETTKKFRIKNMFFPETTYRGRETNYASDIVILQLSEKVTFSMDVVPACLYWDKRERFSTNENIMGKLSGFGDTGNGSLASVLRSAYLPFINYSDCLDKVSQEARSGISFDKFCAGSESGASAQLGDSGGGLLFVDKKSGLYHLRGVVSTRDLSLSYIATFTDITQYTSWITKVVDATEHRFECTCNSDGVVNGKCDSASGSCQCKAFVTGKDCGMCKNGFWNLRGDNPDGCEDCGCSSVGSHTSTCDKISGFCKCKPGFSGRRCDECSDDTLVLGTNGCEAGPKWVKFKHGERCSNAVVGGYAPRTNETLFISRHYMGRHLLLGKLVPSQELSFATLGLTEYRSSEYEVLCGGSVDWVAAGNGDLPQGAVEGGLEINTGNNRPEALYVCRKNNDGYVVPGKLYVPNRLCYIPEEGAELARGEYEVLVQYDTTACKCNSIGSYNPTCEGTSKSCKCKPNVIGKKCDRCALDTYKLGPQGCKQGPKWVKYSNGDKCADAVVGGIDTAANEPVFIIRHRWNHNLHQGKLVPSRKLAYIPGSFSELSFNEYEVLCGDSTKWVAASKGGITSDAVGGGVVYGSVGRETMYVCRVKAEDGSMVPGRLHRFDKVCYYPYKGGEHRSETYEVLQVV